MLASVSRSQSGYIWMAEQAPSRAPAAPPRGRAGTQGTGSGQAPQPPKPGFSRLNTQSGATRTSKHPACPNAPIAVVGQCTGCIWLGHCMPPPHSTSPTATCSKSRQSTRMPSASRASSHLARLQLPRLQLPRLQLPRTSPPATSPPTNQLPRLAPATAPLSYLSDHGSARPCKILTPLTTCASSRLDFSGPAPWPTWTLMLW
jgi:hypothetical protein